MDTEVNEIRLVAEGARVTRDRNRLNPDHPLYNPQIKVAGVWIDVQRGDYSPHDFKSCVLCAMDAARGIDELGVDVVWEVSQFQYDGEDGDEVTALAVGVDTDYVDELGGLPVFPGDDVLYGDDETPATTVPIEELDEPVIRIVKHDLYAGDEYIVQFRVDNRWFTAATLPTIDIAVDLAMMLSADCNNWDDMTDPDNVVWVDRGSLMTGD